MAMLSMAQSKPSKVWGEQVHQILLLRWSFPLSLPLIDLWSDQSQKYPLSSCASSASCIRGQYLHILFIRVRMECSASLAHYGSQQNYNQVNSQLKQFSHSAATSDSNQTRWNILGVFAMIFDYTIQIIMENTTFPYDSKWETVTFAAPAKRIIVFQDVTEYQQRPIHDEYLNFLADLQKNIIGKKISDTKDCPRFDIFKPYFKTLEQLLVETPPIQQPMRYGNRAFKDWYEKANKLTSSFLDEIIPAGIKGAKDELYRYISESWGSNVRIDYGTGHQMSFMYFCWALYRLGFCQYNELQQLVRLLFYRYINLMRKVQVQYMLEPAGSHGVWGLDDYCFLPFLLGAAQLVGHPEIEIPQSIHKSSLIEKYADEFMYINCIKFIVEVKKHVSFAESSPVLNNISGAASWEKVMGGMIKMYKAEVLGKHPVIKHQYFGTIIPY